MVISKSHERYCEIRAGTICVTNLTGDTNVWFYHIEEGRKVRARMLGSRSSRTW